MSPPDERRAPVLGSSWKPGGRERPYGTVTWEEHEEAWRAYARRYTDDQSAERIAERGGFSYEELTLYLGREPSTWLYREAT